MFTEQTNKIFILTSLNEHWYFKYIEESYKFQRCSYRSEYQFEIQSLSLVLNMFDYVDQEMNIELAA